MCSPSLINGVLYITVPEEDSDSDDDNANKIPDNRDPRVLERYQMIEQQLAMCRAEGYAASYQPFAGGEAVVWLLIPIFKLGLGVECLSAWGLNAESYISVRFRYAFK